MHYGIVNECRFTEVDLSESGFSRFRDYQDWNRSFAGV